MTVFYEWLVDYYEAGVNLGEDGRQHGYMVVWPKPDYHTDVHPVAIYWDPTTKFFGQIQGSDPFKYTSTILTNNEEFFTSLLSVLSQPLDKHMVLEADAYPPITGDPFTIAIHGFRLNTLSGGSFSSLQSARARLQELPEEIRNKVANSGLFPQAGGI